LRASHQTRASFPSFFEAKFLYRLAEAVFEHRATAEMSHCLCGHSHDTRHSLFDTTSRQLLSTAPKKIHQG